MNDTEHDIVAQDEWSYRPWRWIPDYVKYPAAVVGGIYRNLSVSKKKDPTLRKEVSFLTMPRTKGNGKSRRAIKKKKANKGKKISRAAKKKMVQIQSLRYRPALPPKFQGPKGFGRRLVSEAKSYKTGSVIRFGSTRMYGELQMSGRQRLGQVTYSTGPQTPVITFDAHGRDDTIFPINPTMLAYFGSPLAELASVFQKFLFTSLILEYDARSATDNNGAFVLAYSSDVDFLEGLGYVGTTPSIAESSVVKLANAKTHVFFEDAKWNPNILEGCSQRNFYTRNEYTGINGGYVLDNAGDTAEDRQSFQGMIMITGNGAGATNNYLWGDLFLNYTVILSDIGAPASAAVTPLPNGTSLVARKRPFTHLEKLKASIDRLSEEKVIDPETPRIGVAEDVYGAASLASSVARDYAFRLGQPDLVRVDQTGVRESKVRSSSNK